MADYSALIEEGVARALPFVCANPDLVVDVGAVQLLCAGSIAAEYERLGGEVFWAGKPHPAAYGTALARAAELRGSTPGLPRILAIGDAVRTDLAAAQGLGVDGLFIAAGIHSDELLAGGEIDPARLAVLSARRARRRLSRDVPIWAGEHHPTSWRAAPALCRPRIR